MRTLLITGLLFLAGVLQAEESTIFNSVQWGVGMMNNSQTEYSQVKIAELDRRGVMTKTFDYNVGVGGWVDSSPYPGTSSSGYGLFEIGVGPHLDHLMLEYYLGGAYIQTPDSVLGSNLQFCHEVLIGIKDSRNVGVFMSIKHFSNAGFVRPNAGRNFITMGVKF